MSSPAALLARVRVSNLLGAFDHEIDFPPDWPFVIIHGPNGIGKTKLLELVKAAASLDTSPLEDIPFSRIDLEFTSGATLSIQRALEWAPNEKINVRLQEDSESSAIEYSYPRSERHIVTQWLLENTRYEPATPDGDIWEDPNDGEIIPFEILARRFRNVIRSHMRSLEDFGTRDMPKPPKRIEDFMSLVNIHLIHTQRLLIQSKAVEPDRPYMRNHGPRWRSAVNEHSEHLKEQLAAAITDNSRIGQELDRSFPSRIMGQDVPTDATEEAVRARYGTQNELRSRLSQFNLIGQQGDVSLPSRRLTEIEIRTLWTYLDDTEKKLGSFQSILERLELFVALMNERLTRKTVSIDIDSGLTITRDDTGDVVGVANLSSGEQHELVLMYDLIFRTPPNATVLIDEPEISLHVAWQTVFISDITRIAELSNIRFIVATHSPQIIDKWWDRTVELKQS
ncbi:AAA family ATPase [Luteipulveratus halotolerans]|uniref:AAA family ATPase n=1 Tax=Luteipulveratus halotolerans TaxID=1631356 RepID=UPI0008FC006D|nr:AAA family ATPase [Luteipulveratus halotolerans]